MDKCSCNERMVYKKVSFKNFNLAALKVVSYPWILISNGCLKSSCFQGNERPESSIYRTSRESLHYIHKHVLAMCVSHCSEFSTSKLTRGNSKLNKLLKYGAILAQNNLDSNW